MSSYERLAHALSVSNLHLLLFELNSGADPNCYCSISGDHILDFAETISEIVALLSFGGTPYSYNEWALAQAIADKKYLHLAVYFYWNFKKPSTASAKHSRAKPHIIFITFFED